MNEALLEAHRKVVESRLQLEVCWTTLILSSSLKIQLHKIQHCFQVARTVGEEAVSLGGGCCAENCPGEGALRQQGSKRRCLTICFQSCYLRCCQEDESHVIFDHDQVLPQPGGDPRGVAVQHNYEGAQGGRR